MNENLSSPGVPERIFGKKRAITLLALAVVVAGALLMLPRNRAARAAGATLYVVPKSGSYSAQSAIFVQASHYGASESVKVYWNYTGPGTGTQVATGTADATGSFSLKFAIPLSATGTYTIAGVGQTSGSVATDTFLLLPQLYGIPEAGGQGSKLNIYGNAFGNGEIVNVYWNYTGPGTGTLLTTATGNTAGSFSVSVPIPTGVAAASIPIAGVGQSSNTTASFPFVLYQPTLTLAPLSGSSGTSLTLTAYGFQKNEKINIFWNNGSTPALVGKTDSDIYGYMPPTTFTVPGGTAPGTYPVTAVGQTSATTVSTNFTLVAPGSSLSVTTAPVGASAKISAQGYAPGETVNIVWGYSGPGTGTTVASATAGLSGLVKTSFNVPTTNAGAYTVAAIGAASGSATQSTFTVATGLAASPARTSATQSVSVSGMGYLGGETVQIYLDSTSGILLTTTTADANGNLTGSVIIPSSTAPGSHSLIAVGQTSGTSFTAALSLDTSWSSFGNDAAQDRANVLENKLSKSNVAGLNLKWTAALGKGFRGSPVYANGVVYVATSTGFLYAVNATSGTLKWKFNSHTNSKNLSAPTVDPATGMVFFGLIGYETTGIPSPIYALDAQTGTLKWSMILAWNVFSPPTVASNTLYIGTDRGPYSTQLYAIDEVTGHVNWQYAAGGTIWGAIAVDISASTAFAFISNPASTLVALDTGTGAVKCQSPIASSSSSTEYGSGVAVANGLVYFNGKNGNVYAVHESDCSSAWTTLIGDQPTGSGNVASLAVANGMVYAGSMNNTLFALDAASGAILWQKSVGLVWGSPIVANGLVYYSILGAKRIWAANATTGAPLWNYLTKGLIYSSPIVVNGWLYCGSTDGNLYAFSL